MPSNYVRYKNANPLSMYKVEKLLLILSSPPHSMSANIFMVDVQKQIDSS